MEFSFYPVGDSRPSSPCVLQHVFGRFLGSKSGITGVPFGRTDLSIGGIGTTLQALSHRHGSVGPSFQGMPRKFNFHMFFILLCFFELEVMNIVNEDGWISVLRADD